MLQAAWGASVLVAFPVVVRQPFATLPQSRFELLTSAAAVGGVFSELFMIKALLVFEPPQAPRRRTGSDPGSPGFKRSLVPPSPADAARKCTTGKQMGHQAVWSMFSKPAQAWGGLFAMSARLDACHGIAMISCILVHAGTCLPFSCISLLCFSLH